MKIRQSLPDDLDGDGLSFFNEVWEYNTDPDNPDTDGDNMPDGWEIGNVLDPLDEVFAVFFDDDFEQIVVTCIYYLLG